MFPFNRLYKNKTCFKPNACLIVFADKAIVEWLNAYVGYCHYCQCSLYSMPHHYKSHQTARTSAWTHLLATPNSNLWLRVAGMDSGIEQFVLFLFLLVLSRSLFHRHLLAKPFFCMYTFASSSVLYFFFSSCFCFLSCYSINMIWLFAIAVGTCSSYIFLVLCKG